MVRKIAIQSRYDIRVRGGARAEPPQRLNDRSAGLPVHCMTLGPAWRNRTVRPSILRALEWPSVTKLILAATALVSPNWFAAAKPSGMIRTPSCRATAATAESMSTGAGRISNLLILGLSYRPWPTRRSRPRLDEARQCLVDGLPGSRDPGSPSACIPTVRRAVLLPPSGSCRPRSSSSSCQKVILLPMAKDVDVSRPNVRPAYAGQDMLVAYTSITAT